MLTTHTVGQVTEISQEQQAFITKFNQSLAPELLWQRLNQSCFLTTSSPSPPLHSPLSPSTFSSAQSYGEILVSFLSH